MVPRTTVGPVRTTVATSAERDPAEAATRLVEQLGTADALYLLFVTAGYPRDELAAELARSWGDRLVGCTTAGNLGPGGFESAPVLAVALGGGDLHAETLLLEPLSDLDTALTAVLPDLERLRRPDPRRACLALLTVDGLANQEEHLAASLKSLLGDVPLIGGSAADDLTFTRTEVLHRGRFAADRATVTIVSTPAPFEVFRLHHYEPDGTVLVITRASPEERIVHEINGIPAAEAFAAAIGVPADELGPEHFSTHPTLLRAAGESWIRSVSRRLPDGGLQFFAAIDHGAVLRLGRPGDAAAALRERLESVRAAVGGRITGILAYDCVLRRIESTLRGDVDELGQVLREFGVAGFSTYGEQFDDFHMNQTIVGVAFGCAPATVGAS